MASKFPAASASRLLVAGIPALNEAADLPGCLGALAAQRGRGLDAVVVCLNNCTDGSADVVRALAPELPFAVVAHEVTLAGARACAGEARRIAMELAADIAGAHGILFGTDADGRAAPDWLAANLAALRAGAEAVAGRSEIAAAEAALLPAHLHEADAKECAYAALLDEIDALLDPDPADPWPRHDEHSGASIAVTVAAYRRAGGIPPLRVAEDRGFFAALRRVDATIRHERAARVVVSGRIVGRAAGGMADTIRRRLVEMDPFLDDRLEPAFDAVRRVSLRARLRQLWQSGPAPEAELAPVARRLRVPPRALTHALGAPYFGATWQTLEAASASLQRQPVAVSALPEQTALARMLRDRLRGRGVMPAADRADTPLRAAVG